MMRPLIVKVNDEKFMTDDERGYVFLVGAEARYDPSRQMIENFDKISAMGTPRATTSLTTYKNVWGDNDSDDRTA